MRKHTVIGAIIFVLISAYPLFLHAALRGGTPVGGRITVDQTQLQAEIACSGSYGPFLLQPIGMAVPGPYFIVNSLRGTPKVGKYFLGLSTPSSGCYNPETGAPIPAYRIDVYGVSR